MNELSRQMEMNLDLRGFALKTKRLYLSHVDRFTRHFDQSPETMGEEEIRSFLHYLIAERELSQPYINQAYSALKFLYVTTLDRTWDIRRIPRSKQHKKLPLVLSEY